MKACKLTSVGILTCLPEIYDDKICTYHVRTANEYRATNGNVSVDTCVEHLLEHQL